jgi:hypothetical protein
MNHTRILPEPKFATVGRIHSQPSARRLLDTLR